VNDKEFVRAQRVAAAMVELKHTEAWEIITDQINHEIEMYRTELETCGEEDLRDTQNMVATLRNFLMYPDKQIAEYEKLKQQQEQNEQDEQEQARERKMHGAVMRDEQNW
jgi:hypothetical protein